MPNDIKKLRRLMFAANHLKKQNPVVLRGHAITASGALKYAWWFENFRTKLASGVYRFSYVKKDGSIREARGTLDLSRIPEDKHPKETEIKIQRFDTFAYYDLDRAGWRSFRLDLFVGFVEQIS